MDLSKVKLVVTDMDGTLLNSKGHVSTNFFHLYEQLKKYNVYFAAASGRQYQSIINKLQIIKDEIFIIAENGGLTVKGDKELQSVTLDPAIVQELIPEIRKIKNIYIVLCGKNSAYIETLPSF